MFTSPRFSIGHALVASAWACSLLVVWPLYLHAQTPKTGWKDAIKLIDSGSAADIVAAAGMLKDASKSSVTLPAPAHLANALIHLRTDEATESIKILSRFDQQFPSDRLGHLTGLRLRAKLVAALSTDDATSAEAALKDLVRLIARGQGDPLDLRAAAHTIGMTVGMLQHDHANSPIAKRILEIGTSSMATAKTRGVNFAYESAFAQAHERAQAVATNLALIQTNGIDALKSEYAQRLESLKKRQAELAEQKELNSEVARNSREQTDQNKMDMRELTREISKLTSELRRPTPGHPGPKVPAPPAPPPRSTIRVQEYETRTEYEYVTQNGEQVRVPVTRTVRRPQYEIDRERDSQYSALLTRYKDAMREYKLYESNYNEDVRSWTINDQTRRQDLANRKADAEARRDELVRANKDIADEKRDFAKELRLKRTAEEQEEFDLEMIQIALEAASSSNLQSAFRPAHFDLLNWSQEKMLLLK